MKQWVRYLCPSYIGLGHGHWCGAKRTEKEWHDATPIDEGDEACRLHDFGCRNAKTQEARDANDGMLYWRWKNYKPRKWYVKMYRSALLIAFKPRSRK